jgi:hypothetical protein
MLDIPFERLDARSLCFGRCLRLHGHLRVTSALGIERQLLLVPHGSELACFRAQPRHMCVGVGECCTCVLQLVVELRLRLL